VAKGGAIERTENGRHRQNTETKARWGSPPTNWLRGVEGVSEVQDKKSFWGAENKECLEELREREG